MSCCGGGGGEGGGAQVRSGSATITKTNTWHREERTPEFTDKHRHTHKKENAIKVKQPVLSYCKTNKSTQSYTTQPGPNTTLTFYRINNNNNNHNNNNNQPTTNNSSSSSSSSSSSRITALERTAAAVSRGT